MAIQHVVEDFEAYAAGTVLTTSNSPFNELNVYTPGTGQTQVVVAPGTRKAMADIPQEALPDPSTTYSHSVRSGTYARRTFSVADDPTWHTFTAAEADFYLRHDNPQTYGQGIDSVTIAWWAGIEIRLQKNLRDRYGNINPPPYTWKLWLIDMDFIDTGQVVTPGTWFNLRLTTPDVTTPGAPAYVYFNGALVATMPSGWPDDPTRWGSATWQTYTSEGFTHEMFGNWQTSPVVWQNTTIYIDNAKWSIQEKELEEPPVEPEPSITGQAGGVRRRFAPGW